MPKLTAVQGDSTYTLPVYFDPLDHVWRCRHCHKSVSKDGGVLVTVEDPEDHEHHVIPPRSAGKIIVLRDGAQVFCGRCGRQYIPPTEGDK